VRESPLSEIGIHLPPKYAVAHNNLGNVYSAQKKYSDAIAEDQQAVSLDPKYAAAHNSLSNVYYNQKEYSEAIVEYQHAVRLDPKDAVPHYIWACCIGSGKQRRRHGAVPPAGVVGQRIRSTIASTD
jgi:tetratricopeptide (TPR) repeat protein